MLVGKVIFNNLTLLMLGALHLGCSCIHHPLLLRQGAQSIFGIRQIGNQPYYNTPYLEMVPIFGNLLFSSNLVHFGTIC